MGKGHLGMRGELGQPPHHVFSFIYRGGIDHISWAGFFELSDGWFREAETIVGGSPYDLRLHSIDGRVFYDSLLDGQYYLEMLIKSGYYDHLFVPKSSSHLCCSETLDYPKFLAAAHI